VIQKFVTPTYAHRFRASKERRVIKRVTTHVAPKVPPLAIGTALRWDIKALDRWLDQRAGVRNDVRSRERLLEDL
jgi:hypothetical protein